MRHTRQTRRTLLRRLARPAGAAALLTVCPAAGGAQVFASEHGLVAQTVNGTTITVDYYRPRAKGREIWGKVVRWDRDWTPGANWATTLEVDHDVRIEGQPLPKGKYSVWAIPNPERWTVIFHRTARVFHTFKPAADDEQLRLTVKPVQGPHVEALTWSFPTFEPNSAELHFQWGTVDVPLHLAVGGPGAVALSAEERAKYVGVYRMEHLNARYPVKTSTYTVHDSAGVLRLMRSVPPDKFYDAQFDLVPVGERKFGAIMYRDGALVGVEPAIALTFTFEGGRATALEVMGPRETVITRGTLERQKP